MDVKELVEQVETNKCTDGWMGNTWTDYWMDGN